MTMNFSKFDGLTGEQLRAKLRNITKVELVEFADDLTKQLDDTNERLRITTQQRSRLEDDFANLQRNYINAGEAYRAEITLLEQNITDQARIHGEMSRLLTNAKKKGAVVVDYAAGYRAPGEQKR